MDLNLWFNPSLLDKTRQKASEARSADRPFVPRTIASSTVNPYQNSLSPFSISSYTSTSSLSDLPPLVPGAGGNFSRTNYSTTENQKQQGGDTSFSSTTTITTTTEGDYSSPLPSLSPEQPNRLTTGTGFDFLRWTVDTSSTITPKFEESGEGSGAPPPGAYCGGATGVFLYATYTFSTEVDVGEGTPIGYTVVPVFIKSSNTYSICRHTSTANIESGGRTLLYRGDYSTAELGFSDTYCASVRPCPETVSYWSDQFNSTNFYRCAYVNEECTDIFFEPTPVDSLELLYGTVYINPQPGREGYPEKGEPSLPAQATITGLVAIGAEFTLTSVVPRGDQPSYFVITVQLIPETPGYDSFFASFTLTDSTISGLGVEAELTNYGIGSTIAFLVSNTEVTVLQDGGELAVFTLNTPLGLDSGVVYYPELVFNPTGLLSYGLGDLSLLFDQG